MWNIETCRTLLTYVGLLSTRARVTEVYSIDSHPSAAGTKAYSSNVHDHFWGTPRKTCRCQYLGQTSKSGYLTLADLFMDMWLFVWEDHSRFGVGRDPRGSLCRDQLLYSPSMEGTCPYIPCPKQVCSYWFAGSSWLVDHSGSDDDDILIC